MSVLLLQLFLFTSAFCGFAPTEKLTFVRTSSRLPTAVGLPQVVYDGKESIYVYGGNAPNGTYLTHMVRYSVASGQVQVVGEFLDFSGSTAVFNGGDILNFGGEEYSEIIRYNTLTGNLSMINELPHWMCNMASVTHGRTVYLFGGNGPQRVSYDQIFEYSMTTNQIQHVATLPTPRAAASAAWVDGQIYIFGGRIHRNPTAHILKFDPVTRKVTKLKSMLPDKVIHSCAMPGDGIVYIFNGAISKTQIRFNPKTQVAKRVRVGSWPPSYARFSCVHVPKLARLYIIGGATYAGGVENFLEHISYVQLSKVAESARRKTYRKIGRKVD